MVILKDVLSLNIRMIHFKLLKLLILLVRSWTYPILYNFRLSFNKTRVFLTIWIMISVNIIEILLVNFMAYEIFMDLIKLIWPVRWFLAILLNCNSVASSALSFSMVQGMLLPSQFDKGFVGIRGFSRASWAFKVFLKLLVRCLLPSI